MSRVARRRSVAGWLGAIGGSVVFVAAVIYLFSIDLDEADKRGSVFSVLIGLLGLGASIWGVVDGRRSSDSATPTARLMLAKAVLADAVLEQWRNEVLIRSLDQPDPMPVPWTIAGVDMMDHPDNIAATNLVTFTANSDSIAALVERFRDLRRSRLVILGGAGTGKTTLAVQLLRELLRVRIADEPVPVLLTAASWNLEMYSTLQDWIAAQLEQDYSVLREAQLESDIPRLLATRGAILPIIDGLDELPTAAQARMILAINNSLTDSDQIILTSRTDEFGRAVRISGRALTSGLVLESGEITPQLAADYLRRCLPTRPGPVWEALLNALRISTTDGGPVSALAATTSTALGLWLVRMVYVERWRGTEISRDINMDDIARFSSGTALQEYLLEQLVEAVIETRQPSGNPGDRFLPRVRYDAEEARRWLRFIAVFLRDRAAPPWQKVRTEDVVVRDLSWWKLGNDLGTISTRTQNLVSAVIGVLAGLVGGYEFGSAFGLKGWLVAGIACGAAGYLPPMNVLGFHSWQPPQPGFADLRLKRRWRQLSTSLRRSIVGLGIGGMAAGCAAGAALELIWQVHGAFIGYAIIGAWLGFMAGIATGLVNWAETPGSVARNTLTPLDSWRQDRALLRLRVIIGGIAGLVAGSLMGWFLDGISGIVHGVPIVIMLAVIGAFMGQHHASLVYSICVWRLSRAKQLPRRLMTFFDDAHRLGLLRSVGPIYQFRHADLQDQLARSQHHVTT